eukprot:SAG31_NODE_4486_length_3194_cov_7.612278_1_plen_339_part_10
MRRELGKLGMFIVAMYAAVNFGWQVRGFLSQLRHPQITQEQPPGGHPDVAASTAIGSGTKLSTAGFIPQEIAATLAPSVPPACPRSNQPWLPNIELRGEEEKHFAATEPGGCCVGCAELSECAGFTYNSVEKLCRFKLWPAGHRDRAAKPALTAVACDVCTSFTYDKVLSQSFHAPPLATSPTTPAGAAPNPTPERSPLGLSPSDGCAGTAVDKAFAAQILASALGDRSPKPDNNRDATKDVVLVTAWRRPAFLLQTLARLLSADLSEEHRFVVVLEHGYEPLIDTVRPAAFASKCCTPISRPGTTSPAMAYTQSLISIGFVGARCLSVTGAPSLLYAT